ncbi:MAG TPA: hypothetical protein VGG02_01115 [Chthoniobacterales bacterium]
MKNITHRLLLTLPFSAIAAPLALAGTPTIQVVGTIDYPKEHPIATDVFGVASTGVNVADGALAVGIFSQRFARSRTGRMPPRPGDSI